MISLDNLKTTLNAIKCLLTDYPKKKDIPTKLPNPNPLTFTGAVTGSYDGSEVLTVEIPSGGSSVLKPLTYDYMPGGYPTKSRFTIEWDGNTEGLTAQGPWYKVSDLVVDPSVFASGATLIYADGSTDFMSIDAALPKQRITIEPGKVTFGEGQVRIFTETPEAPYEAFEIGVYFESDEIYDVRKVTGGEVITPMAEEFIPATAKLSGPIKTGSLLRGDADNVKWSEVDADGGYGWQDVKEINFTSDMYDAAEKITYIETDSGGNETEVTAFVKISDDVITMEEAESICALTFIADGEPVVYDFTQAPYNKIQQVGTTGISLYYSHIFSCSQAEDVKDLFGVETPVMVPAGTWLLNELALEASYYPFKVSHGIKHIIDKSYLPDSEPVRYIYQVEFSKLASDLRSGKTVILTDYSLTQGGRIINFGGDMKTYITLTYDSSPSAKYKYVPDNLGNIYFGSHTSVEATNAELYLKSSTADSTKTFKITVDDSGTISATEVT